MKAKYKIRIAQKHWETDAHGVAYIANDMYNRSAGTKEQITIDGLNLANDYGDIIQMFPDDVDNTNVDTYEEIIDEMLYELSTIERNMYCIVRDNKVLTKSDGFEPLNICDLQDLILVNEADLPLLKSTATAYKNARVRKLNLRML